MISSAYLYWSDDVIQNPFLFSFHFVFCLIMFAIRFIIMRNPFFRISADPPFQVIWLNVHVSVFLFSSDFNRNFSIYSIVNNTKMKQVLVFYNLNHHHLSNKLYKLQLLSSLYSFRSDAFIYKIRIIFNNDEPLARSIPRLLFF